MADLDFLAGELQAAKLDLTDVLIRQPREICCTVAVEQLVALADALQEKYAARPELIAAEDTRGAFGAFTLRYVFELEKRDAFIVVSALVPEGDLSFPSLATRWYLASRFEREIHDLFGLTPTGHPDLRRLPLHQYWPAEYYPLRKDAVPPTNFADDGTPFPFRRVNGEGIYEISVGPVHAGIIEPGHFRFSVEGETIINLESRMYFVHKGIERLFESAPLTQAIPLAERISGDSSVGHAMAFCQAVESLAAVSIPSRAAYLRVILLELERIYNHIGDVGAIISDTGYAVANAHAMRLREEVLRLNARLFGHRLLRGALTPGGMATDLTTAQVADLRATIPSLMADFREVVEIALANGLVLDRLQGTGRLTNLTAREMQVVGVPARASGIDADVRRDHPYAAYAELAPRVVVREEGDVWARLLVRVEEVRAAEELLMRASERLPLGKTVEEIGPLPPGGAAFGLVEGWRGPIWHWVAAGEGGRLARVKIKDPSFANWPALSYAILKNIVPDFPLVNKSFNLSYAGNDL